MSSRTLPSGVPLTRPTSAWNLAKNIQSLTNAAERTQISTHFGPIEACSSVVDDTDTIQGRKNVAEDVQWTKGINVGRKVEVVASFL